MNRFRLFCSSLAFTALAVLVTEFGNPAHKELDISNLYTASFVFLALAVSQSSKKD